MHTLKGLLILLLAFTFTTSFTSDPPCGSDAFLEECAPSLGQCLYLQSFDIKDAKEGQKTEFRYLMSKGSKYRVVICDGTNADNEMKVRLLDRDKKLLVSNQVNGKYYGLFEFECSATGVYYLQSSFKPSKQGCGSIILGLGK